MIEHSWISNHSNSLRPLSTFPLPDTPLRRYAKSSIKVIICQEQETFNTASDGQCKKTDEFLTAAGGEGCHLRVVPPGQLLRRPSTPKPFIKPGFVIFLTWSFLCLLSGGFSLRLLCLFSNSFQFKFFIYSLYIHIYIFYIFFTVLVVPYSALTNCDRSVVLVLDDRPDPQLWGHCRSTHSSSMICFFVFAVVSFWHPGDGRDVRKKPVPYNYFFTLLF